MNLSIPILVEEQKRPHEPVPEFFVRPLFFPEVSRREELLSRAMSKLAGDLRNHLEEIGKQMRHEALAEWSFSPELREHRLNLTLQLRRLSPRCKALFLTFPALERTIAFTPALPDVWFEVGRGEKLEPRATEVLSAYFRLIEKEDEKAFAMPPQLLDPPASWVTTIEIDVHPRQKMPADALKFLFLGGNEEMSGQGELRKVGRCFDSMYPDELDRVILRDAEIEELTRLLEEPDKRPVLLVGPARVGKTALVHEHVYRRVRKRENTYGQKENVWLISPQRLISGMSYVGQWENRLLSILKEAEKRNHVLYFDDLLGLFQAGLTSNSDLSIAHVLRPYIERRDVRVLAEITPQALRVLQERDRAFADLFHVLPVKEPAEPETWQILIESARQLEGQHRCTMYLDVLPTVLELQRRFVRDLAMPGKAAGFLRQLVVKYRNRSVDRRMVIQEFHAKSGLSVQFVDQREKLDRSKVVEALAGELIGQPAAIEAMADVISVAKARLNDLGRPLASFLFVGPTGVGKTQAAKALAKFLFGDAERLLRFDMNEYVDPGSASRLIGTFSQPEGLLTSAIRRQPFAVILLDEIEKAEADVFDLLLQVLGEGRLTDALGRTADFANAIIILTSNLGVRESGHAFGLRPGERGRDEVFIGAAEAFFRPEFFNRLDRLVPFSPLGRGDIERIAAHLIRSVFERDGLLQRKCVLRVDPRAMEKIVDQGFHPQLGARALKRAIEKQLTRPVAARLASLEPGTPTVISVYPGGDGIAVHTQGLGSALREPARRVDITDPGEVLDRVLDVADRVDAQMAEAQPDETITQGQIRPEQFRYFAVREQLDRVRNLARRAYDRLHAPKQSRVVSGRASPRIPNKQNTLRLLDSQGHALWRAIAAAEQVNHYVAELTKSAPVFGQSMEDQVRQAAYEAALLDVIASAGAADDRVLIHVRALADTITAPQALLRHAYLDLFDRQFGFSCALADSVRDEGYFGPASEVMLLEMPAAAKLLPLEEGTHLFIQAQGQLLPVQVMVMPLCADETVDAVARRHWEDREGWRAALAKGTASPEDDPWALRPVIRVYDVASGAVDVRSGLVASSAAVGPSDVRTFLLSQLPLPVELL